MRAEGIRASAALARSAVLHGSALGAVGLTLLVGTGALAGCSSKSHSPAGAAPGTTDSNGGVGGASDDADVGGEDDGSSAATPTSGATNPDGIPYPSANHGRTPRTGNTPGRVIQNFVFSGFPNADMSQGLQPIALANFYDPCKKRYSLIHLNVAAVWCTPCNEETAAMVADADWIAQQGIVVLQALNDGPTLGTGATLADLQGWIHRYSPGFTEMLDPDPQPMLGAFFDAAAVPWNADIDPRTMEILSSGTGWSGDVRTSFATPLQQVSQPASYPLPSCN